MNILALVSLSLLSLAAHGAVKDDCDCKKKQKEQNKQGQALMRVLLESECSPATVGLLIAQFETEDENSQAEDEKQSERRSRLQAKIIELLRSIKDPDRLDAVEKFVDKFRAQFPDKRAKFDEPRPYIGFFFAPLDDDEKDALAKHGINGGVKVGQIIPGTPAEKSGLKPGDILLSARNEGDPSSSSSRKGPIEDVKLNSSEDLLNFLQEKCRPNDMVKFSTLRDGSMIDVRVTIGETKEPFSRPFAVTGIEVEDVPLILPDKFDQVEGARLQRRIMELTKVNESLRDTIRQLEERLSELQDKQPVREQKQGRPYIGVKVTETDADDLLRLVDYSYKSGIRIVSVEKGSPADKAGLKQGDIIVTVNDKVTEKYEDMEAIMRAARPGDSLRVRVIQMDGTLSVLTVAVEEKR